MKIGIVCYPTFGGSGVVATELGLALANEGHAVHFITYSQPIRFDHFNQNLFYHEVDVATYPLFQYPPYVLALASKMVDVVKHEKLDLLHVHYAIPHASAGFLAKEILATENIHIPVITTLHGTDITLVGKDPTYEPVVTFSIDKSDAVTAVSEDLRRDTYEHFNIKKDIKVIPNFVDLDRFKKHKMEHFKKAICPNDEKLIIHTSNFRKVKRVTDVVKVFSNISKVMPAKLLLAGDGPDRANAENLSRELGIDHDVRFLGKLDAVQEILSVSDLFIMPSEKESFGLAALEAMACEVPVISSNTGGLPELNINGKTGFMSNIGDIEDMTKNALFILDDNNLPGFKENALNRAREFDTSKILPMYEEVYNEVLDRQKAQIQQST